jgi:hypothetical protein
MPVSSASPAAIATIKIHRVDSGEYRGFRATIDNPSSVAVLRRTTIETPRLTVHTTCVRPSPSILLHGPHTRDLPHAWSS